MVNKWMSGLRFKLLIMSMIPCLSLFLLFLLSYSTIQDLRGGLEKANLVRGPLITYSGDMMTGATGLARWTVTALWQINNESERESALKKVSQSLKEFEEAKNAYVALPRAPRAREIFRDVEQTWPELQRVLQEVLELAHSKDPGKQVQAESLYISEGRPRVGKIVETIQKLNDERRKMMESETAEDLKASSNSILFMVTGGAAAILISLVTMIAVINFIIRNMNSITENLFSSAASLTTASQQLSISSTEVAASSSETAASIQETVASLEEMTSMVKTTDENSQLSLEVTHRTHQQAQKSEAKLNELTSALSEISASASKITDIIQVIDDISFQTNLLALNAAVEAARAGEQGKGFAVVAEAVRGLAQKSAVSAKEIGDLIRKSVEKTHQGVQIGDECKTLMVGMFESLKKVSLNSEEIAKSSREQSLGMDQISKAMNQLDQATQQNTTASAQISQASNVLSQQAVDLKTVVDHLKEIVDGAQEETPRTSSRTEKPQATKMPKLDRKPAKASEPKPAPDDFFAAPQQAEATNPKKPGTKNDFGLDDVA